MAERPTISFAQAQAAMAAMIEKANQTPEKPVAMAIVDFAGDLLAFAVMDNLRLFTPRHALRKAYTAAITGLDSSVHAEWLKTRGLTVSDYGGDPNLTPSGGGVVVRAQSPWYRTARGPGTIRLRLSPECDGWHWGGRIFQDRRRRGAGPHWPQGHEVVVGGYTQLQLKRIVSASVGWWLDTRKPQKYDGLRSIYSDGQHRKKAIRTMQEARVDTVVQDGEVVTSSQVYQASIAIKDEKIVALGPKEFLPPAERYIDASGKYVLPGAIDAHVHLGEVDDYSSGSKAAAYAGLTTMIPFTVCDGAKGETVPQTIDRIREEGESQSVVDFAFSSILTNEPYLLQGIPQAFEMGVTSFKMYMTYKKRGNRMCPDDFICKAMEIIAAHGGFTQLHCENGDIIDFLEDKFIAEGRVKPVDYPSSAPGWVEEEAINRAIKMGALTHCPTYVVHLSTQLGLERIKQAQAQGQKVWCETCPQYMLLSDAEMERWGPHAKIGPPLRPRDGPDPDSLWRGSEEGYISIVASDHAPRDRASREGGWNNVFVDSEGKSILFGSPGLETLVPLAYSEGVVTERPTFDLDGSSPCREPGKSLRAVPPKRGHQRRGRRRFADNRSGQRGDYKCCRSPQQCGVHPVRGLEGEGLALDDPAARTDPLESGCPGTEAGLRPVSPPPGALASLRRACQIRGRNGILLKDTYTGGMMDG